MNDEEAPTDPAGPRTGAPASPDAEEAWRSIRRVIELQARLTDDPDAVDDEEIRAEYGEDLEPASIRELFAKSTFGRRAKDQRASARGRLRRRLVDLADALDDAEQAIDGVFAALGRTNGRTRLEGLKTAIGRFRDENGLSATAPAERREVRSFEEMLAGEGAWPAPSPGADGPADAAPPPAPPARD